MYIFVSLQLVVFFPKFIFLLRCRMVGFNFFFNSVYTNPAMDHLVLMVAIQCYAKGPNLGPFIY